MEVICKNADFECQYISTHTKEKLFNMSFAILSGGGGGEPKAKKKKKKEKKMFVGQTFAKKLSAMLFIIIIIILFIENEQCEAQEFFYSVFSLFSPASSRPFFFFSWQLKKNF